jgi:exopolysaccharide biosynthesis WecB/TagA/CpsF family protein
VNEVARLPNFAPPIDFLSVRFDPLPQAAVLEEAVRMAASEKFHYVVTPNVDHVVKLHADGCSEIEAAYRQASLRVCDSQILRGLARASDLELPLVTGSDLTRELVMRLEREGAQIAVIGGDAALLAQLRALFPGVSWEQHRPPMGVLRDPEAQRAIASFVEGSAARVFLFAIGFPQSEIVCSDIARIGRARGVALCIGASLEFLTGAKRRAPVWMQRIGAEWLFRLASEPARLWRRYLVQGPRVFAIWRKWRVSGSRSAGGSGSSHAAGS